MKIKPVPGSCVSSHRKLSQDIVENKNTSVQKETTKSSEVRLSTDAY